MRVSTSMAFELGVTTINRQQAELLKTQQQLSTGRRVVSAADDPAAAARAVEVSSGAARNTRYMANQDAARTSLTQVESTLGQFSDALQDVRALLIQAGNGAYSDLERANIAADLTSRSDYLMSLANARDANGAYIFAGFQEGVPAFAKSAAGIAFQGDQGARQLQVSDGRSLQVGASGADIFERVRTGNGIFETAGQAINLGSAVIEGGQVIDANLLNGHAYQIVFHVNLGVTTYDVNDTTLGSTVTSGNAYTPDGLVTIAGMQTQINGMPADGDGFTITPSVMKSVFSTIASAVKALQKPAGAPAARAQQQMGISNAVAGIDRAMDSTSLARSNAGAGLRELDSLKSLADGRDLQYQTELSDLLDVDYTKAISDLTRLQTMSQATQKAFVNMVGKNLFDLL